MGGPTTEVFRDLLRRWGNKSGARVDGRDVYVTKQPLVCVSNLPNVHITLGYLPLCSVEFV
eukprot:8260285-Lingulodinium_polyedra.AAC.1